MPFFVIEDTASAHHDKIAQQGRGPDGIETDQYQGEDGQIAGTPTKTYRGVQGRNDKEGH